MAEFDQYAKNYRSLHNENLTITGFESLHFVEVKVNWLARYEKNDSLKVLDLGCGDGYTAEAMFKLFPKWQIEAIEVSQSSIDVAKQKHAPNTNFQWFNGKNVPFDNEAFDVVFIACIFHHVPLNEHFDLLNEAKRVLKKGGRIYLFEHNPYNPGTQYLVKTCVFDKTAHLVSANHFTKLFKQQQWQVNFVKYLIFFPGWKWLKPLLRLENYLSWLPIGGQYFISATKK
jgi:ubiquinone/menaquinone biosynthesis C-methylase UbiE